MHARHAAQPIHPLAQANQCRQKARCSARISYEKLQRVFVGPGLRNFAPQASDPYPAIAELLRVRLDFSIKAQLLQRLDHHLGVLAQSPPSSLGSPSPSAAKISARLVMLLEPGTEISARTGLSSGMISIKSGRDIFTQKPLFAPRNPAVVSPAQKTWRRFCDFRSSARA